MKFLKGFTLLEVLVVISLFGIFSAIGLTKGSDFLDRRQDAKRIADIDLLKTSIEQFYEKNNAYPGPACTPTCSDSVSDSGSGSTPWIPGLTANYLKVLPKDPEQASSVFENIYALIFPSKNEISSESVGQVASSHTTLIFSDTFTGATQIITAHTPDLGSGWSYGYRDTNENGNVSGGVLTSTGSDLNNGFIAIANDTPASANYQVTTTMTTGDSSDDTTTLVARWQDVNNTYAWVFASDTGSSSANRLMKRVGGIWTQLFTGCTTVGTGAIVTLKVEGSTITAIKNGATACTATDSSLTAAGKGGVGFGSFVNFDNDDMSGQVVDNFKIETLTPPSPPPTVTTQTETNITDTTATLNGQANPNGDAATGWFRYSTTSPGTCNDTFGTRAPTSGGTSLGSGSSAVAYSENISSLTASTTYYFCAIASNGGGTGYGLPLSFTTSAAPQAPTVTTQAATNINTTTATLNGQANPNGQATTGWYRFSAVNGNCNSLVNVTSPTTDLGSGSSTIPYAHDISGLTIGTIYYFCAVAQNPTGTTYGTVLSFTTLTAPVPVVTLTANGQNGPISVSPGSQVTIAWTATNSPTSCTASGASDWTGTKDPAGGSQSVTVDANTTYTLSCENSYGPGQDSVVVNLTGTGGVYVYWVSANRLSFQIWAVLENTKDPRIYTHPDAKCKDTPPAEVLAVGPYNFCGSF